MQAQVQYFKRSTDVLVRDNGGSLVLLRPVSARATSCIEQALMGETTWYGVWLVVEPRYLGPIVDGLGKAGMKVEVLS